MTLTREELVYRCGWAGLSVIVALTSACAAGNIKIDQDNLSALKDGPPLVLVRSTPPMFLVSDPGNSYVASLFGVSGGTLVMSGRSAAAPPLNEEFGLHDPAEAVGDKVFEALAFELGVKRDPSERLVLKDQKPETVARSGAAEGWLLEVTTSRWGLEYDHRFPSRYHVQLQAIGRLYDLSRQRVVWQATCNGSEAKTSEGALLTELTAYDGLELRERLDTAAGQCAEQLVANLFSGVR